MLTIAVAGATGYAGTEILKLLVEHPGYEKDFTVTTLAAGGSAGDLFGQRVQSIPSLSHVRIQPVSAELLAQQDIVFLALPHGVSASYNLPATQVIDCAADYRLKSSQDWEKYYGSSHAGTWTYGLPEMPGHREAISTSEHVAVPGCFPTGSTLAVLPAAQAGVIEPDINVVSVTGVSGAGKKAATNLLGAETIGSLRPYNVGVHRHTPEIKQNVAELFPDTNQSEQTRVTFTPVLAPITRGIISTVTARTTASPEEIRAHYQKFSDSEYFIHLLPEGVQPETKNVLGSNMVHLQVMVTDGVMVATSAIDNLTKGTAGAAIQCMNLMNNWGEHAGLTCNGL